MKNKNNKKVAVAMSGGVDSAVAALLLKEQGFDVHGFFMKNWHQLPEFNNQCPWEQDYEDMRKVCQHLEIPYATINLEKEYKEKVLNYFFKSYQNNLTPNPDIMCNRQIKFNAFWKKVNKLGFDYMATGHYAKKVGNSLILPKDSHKDQTYFLCTLSKEQIKRTLFPLGDFTKKEVRKLAESYNLPVAQKKDSQGICFIGHIKVRDFLKSNIKTTPGNVLNMKGETISKHDGVELYTIGQRRLGVATNGQPLYVVEKKGKDIIMGEKKDLYKNKLKFNNANWLEDLPENFNAQIQIRYNGQFLEAEVNKDGHINLKDSAQSITPGQFVAFYKNKTLLGGAVIK